MIVAVSAENKNKLVGEKLYVIAERVLGFRLVGWSLIVPILISWLFIKLAEI